MRPRHSLTDLDDRIAALPQTRARLPELVRNRFASRHRRAVLGHDGRLLLVSTEPILADSSHPCPDRADLLHRLAVALECPGVDGIVASSDVIEDLLMLEVLEDRVVFGALRLSVDSPGSRPRLAGCDPATIAATHLEGGALTCPLDVWPPGQDAAAALPECAAVVGEMAAHSLVTLVSVSAGSRGIEWSATAAAGLGARSTYTWLVLPDGAQAAAAAAATTLPLVVEPEPGSDPDAIGAALAIPAVLGIVVGRAALYPDDGQVEHALAAFARRVHPELAG